MQLCLGVIIGMVGVFISVLMGSTIGIYASGAVALLFVMLIALVGTAYVAFRD